MSRTHRAERIEKKGTVRAGRPDCETRPKALLGMVFVTQLPQHLPRQIFGLVNSYISHRITDPQVVAALRNTVSGIHESLRNRLPELAPRQALASFPHLTRPLMVSVDPAAANLRLSD